MEEYGKDRVCTAPRRNMKRLRCLAAACWLALLVSAPALAGDLQVDGSFVTTVPTGTPPLAVASTTRVDGLNADLLDGLDASAFATAPERVLWVAKSGGQFSSVQDALNAITDASPSKRYLVHVAPGIYVEPVVMKPHVDIAGSGEAATILRAFADVTVMGASNAELRDLTVENFGAALGGGTGIHNAGAATRIVRVTVRAEVATGTPVGIYNDGSPPYPGPLLRQVTVSAQGSQARGVHTSGGRVTVHDSRITASGKHSRAIMNSSGAVAFLARVDAQAFHGDTENDTPVHAIWTADSFLELVDVDARTVGGSPSHGVYLQDGTARGELTRVRVSVNANGGQNAYGIYVVETALDVVDCEVSANAASSSNRGLLNRRSDVRVFRSTLTASGGTSAYGLANLIGAGAGSAGPWTVEVHASQLRGSDRPVLNEQDFTIRIGATYLGGNAGVYNPTGGTVVCAGVYDEFFTFYPDTCP